MRLIELITIYLAAAAPVGVIAFLRLAAEDERRSQTVARDECRSHAAGRVARAAAAGLLFPFTLFSYALKLRRAGRDAGEADSHDAKIDAARRSLLAAVRNFGDLARALRDGRAAATADAAHALTSHVERYAGLTLALDRSDPAGELDDRETELARVAGRDGDDLETAGRCVRRRNISRLREQQSRSRIELLHALADLQDALDLPAGPRHAQSLAPALLRVYERAFSLFMLLEDERGAQTLTRLLDATRSRLYRRNESHAPGETAAGRPRRDPTGDSPCKPHNSRTTSAPIHSTPLAATPTQHTPTLPTPLSARG
ncbi:MAG: hypothetical protein M3268_02825 [Acidobacteriota bacterium]|nr:hypothetical protein [Acidobacteriota bacterium]